MKKAKRQGRPKKKAAEKKSFQISVRLTKEAAREVKATFGGVQAFLDDCLKTRLPDLAVK